MEIETHSPEDVRNTISHIPRDVSSKRCFFYYVLQSIFFFFLLLLPFLVLLLLILFLLAPGSASANRSLDIRLEPKLVPRSTDGPQMDPSWHQEGVKRAKLEPRLWQVGAKRGQKERRGGLRSDLETKSRILKLVVFHLENVYFLDIGSARWRQVGVDI